MPIPQKQPTIEPQLGKVPVGYGHNGLVVFGQMDGKGVLSLSDEMGHEVENNQVFFYPKTQDFDDVRRKAEKHRDLLGSDWD